MNTERLLKTAAIMEALPPALYNQNAWLLGDDSTLENAPVEELSITYEGKPVRVLENFCGTAACVLGHAAFDPEFQHAGLRVAIVQDSWGDVDAEVVLVGKNREVEVGLTAAASFYGIDLSLASALFGWGASDWHNSGFYTYFAETYAEYISPAIVARAIRAFVESDGMVVVDHMNKKLVPLWRKAP